MIIKLAMKEQEKSHKATVELRKHSLSEKTRSDYSSPFTTKEDSFGVFLGKGGKTFGKKYVQQNMFKMREKEHHEIVISDEVVRNSKLFRMLKEKMVMRDAIFIKEFNELTQNKSKLQDEIKEIRGNNQKKNLELWELKNQILELKNILNDQQQESRRLEKQIEQPQGQYAEMGAEEQAEEEAREGSVQGLSQNGNSEGKLDVHSREQNHSFRIESNPEHQSQGEDIKLDSIE